MSDGIVPALMLMVLLSAARKKTDAYAAFAGGVKRGLITIWEMAPYVISAAVMAAIPEASGLQQALEKLLMPVMRRMNLPVQALGTVLLRPISASAALGAAAETIASCGVDSRAARIACIVCGAGETVLMTGALYLGAAGVRTGRYAIPAAMAGYACMAVCACLTA